MKEISLKYREWTREESPRTYGGRSRYVPNLDMEELYIDLIKKVRNKEKVYVKFPDNHDKRPGAIALVNKISGEEFKTRSYQNVYDKTQTLYEDTNSWLVFHLKWDDRKNTTKIDINNYHNRLVYLPDYTGPTVWSFFDPKEFAKQNSIKTYDRMGRELSVNDTVIYINARYGSGACIDFGVIREIKNKTSRGYSGPSVTSEVIIETIALNEGDYVEKSKIKRPENSIMRMTDVDLMDDAFVKKLTVTQKTIK